MEEKENGQGKQASISSDLQNSQTDWFRYSGKKIVKLRKEYRNYVGAIYIPENVISIDKEAFSGCKGLTSITIPDGVKSIGDSAFSDCESLTKIIMPDGVISIGFGAFSRCIHLTNIPIPNSVTRIGDYAFSGCKGLTSIAIPDGVTSIGKSAFEDCTGLSSITIPNSVISIGEAAFKMCSSLSNLKIGSGVTRIGERAFQNCSSLKTITIPKHMRSIGAEAFQGCASLIEVINLSWLRLQITAGSHDNGWVAYYAKEVHIGYSQSQIVNRNGYQFYTCKGIHYLIGCVRSETALTLPSAYHGEPYQIYRAFCGCKGLKKTPSVILFRSNYRLICCGQNIISALLICFLP